MRKPNLERPKICLGTLPPQSLHLQHPSPFQITATAFPGNQIQFLTRIGEGPQTLIRGAEIPCGIVPASVSCLLPPSAALKMGPLPPPPSPLRYHYHNHSHHHYHHCSHFLLLLWKLKFLPRNFLIQSWLRRHYDDSPWVNFLFAAACLHGQVQLLGIFLPHPCSAPRVFSALAFPSPSTHPIAACVS